jgi:acyl-coenzyme A synthetase/AMP-(fatty) acid ligase
MQLAAASRADAIVTSPNQARDAIQESKRTPFVGVSIGALLLGGGLASRALLTEVRARLCANTIVQYGATESGPIGITPAELPMETESAAGRPLPGVSTEIVDEEDRTVPNGVEGHVCVRTPTMGRGFPAHENDTQTYLRDGWFYPGDTDRLREDGVLVLGGRASEVVNSGGVKCAPARIEEVVLRRRVNTLAPERMIRSFFLDQRVGARGGETYIVTQARSAPHPGRLPARGETGRRKRLSVEVFRRSRRAAASPAV